METHTNLFQPARLRLARLFHGLTHAELGARASSSRQFMHQLESGIKTPNELMVNVLSEQLEVDPSFFFTPIAEDVVEQQCHFRKQRTTPAKITQQVLARGTLFSETVSKLEEYLDLPEVDFPEIPVNSRLDVEQAAERCRKHWGLGVTAPIVNMVRVAENAGAVVTHFEGVSEKVDALSVSRRRPLIVMSTSKGSGCRSRFDIGHEIGHLVMHQGVETGDHDTESQANHFAAAFLFPRSAFVAEFPRDKKLNWTTLYQLKLKYKISVAAILYRAHHHLGLIDATQYRVAQIYLSRSTQKKIEKYDEAVAMEQPELLVNAFRALLEEEEINTEHFASQIAINPNLLEKLTGVPNTQKPITKNRQNIIDLLEIIKAKQNQ